MEKFLSHLQNDPSFSGGEGVWEVTASLPGESDGEPPLEAAERVQRVALRFGGSEVHQGFGFGSLDVSYAFVSPIRAQAFGRALRRLKIKGIDVSVPTAMSNTGRSFTFQEGRIEDGEGDVVAPEDFEAEIRKEDPGELT